jgi:hypothetical protein
VDSGQVLGRVDVELLGQDAVVTWLARATRGGEILARRISPSGGGSEAITIARTAADRASGFPRMSSYQGALYVAWTENSSRQGPSRVQLARLIFE